MPGPERSCSRRRPGRRAAARAGAHYRIGPIAEPSMSVRIRLFMTMMVVAGAVALPGLPARAESLRCSGGSVAEGDSRLSVAYKCGPPLLADSHCAPLHRAGTLQPVLPGPFAGAFLPCLQTEQWLYDRGPGNLMATVRFRSGTVQSIVYGRLPH